MTTSLAATPTRAYPAKLSVATVRTEADLRAFLDLPWSIYQGDPNWVPPLLSEHRKLLDRARHPFHQHAEVELFLARDSDRPVGRIAAIVNHAHNEFHHDRMGFFGFFESVDSLDVARGLFDTAAAWLKARERDVMLGPMNLSTNEECGLLVEGFESPPVFMMTYNPRYYVDLYERSGLTKARDLYAYHVPASVADDKGIERLERIVGRVRERNRVQVRSVDLRQFEAEVGRIKEVYNGAWTTNWGFVPMTDAEVDLMAKDFRPIAVPDLVLIAEVDGRPVGASLTLPDLNVAIRHMNGRLWPFGVLKLLWYQRQIRRVRLMVLGVVNEYQRRGVDAVLMLETLRRSLKLGYTEAELSWVLEDNVQMNNTIATFNLQRYKTYRFYERPVMSERQERTHYS